jgi:cytochrome c'
MRTITILYRYAILSIALITGSLTTVNLTAIERSEESLDHSLPDIMLGLLKNTHLLTEGIVLSDYKKIEIAAGNIANHPQISIKTKMKLVANLGAEMANFKSNDDVVHNAAVALEKAVQNKNMVEIISKYNTLVQGCQSCHSQFRERVSDILK